MTLNNEASADATAVAAVLDGDRERFRELVERYEDKVFAVAWSRLGDRSLAEDAAQETFISAYRRLTLLGGAEKFGHWVTTIARNTAINLGMRNRSELSKRERWSLERTGEDAGDASRESGADAATNADTLRQSMAELPAIHRECLVLFYLEDRSVREASALLGLSETAFKTRLNRARHALRAVIESRLEESLESLRPSAQFASAVMLAMPAGKPGVAMIGGALGFIAKMLPAFAGWLFLAVPLAMIPVDRWVARKTAANFREQDGFRARDFRKFSRKASKWIVIGTLLVVAVGIATVLAIDWIGNTEWARNAKWQGPSENTMAIAAKSFLWLLVLGYGAMLWRKWRMVLLTRHRYIIAEWCAQASIVAGFAAWALGCKSSVFFLAMAGNVLCTGIGTPARPLRMDYSLFHRAFRRVMKIEPSPAAPARHFSLEILRDFARFLGKPLLALNWRPHPQGIEILLNVPGPGIASIWASWKTGHTLILRENGDVSAHLTALGLRILNQTATVTDDERPALEAAVASAVRRSLDCFASGDVAGANVALGEITPASIFIKDPAKAAGMRWRTAGHFVLAAAFLYFAWLG